MYAVRTSDRTTVRRSSTDGVSFERYDRIEDRPERHPLGRPDAPAASAGNDTATGAPTAEAPVLPRAWDAKDGSALETLDEMAAVRAAMNLSEPNRPRKQAAESESEKREREALQALGYLDQ